MNDWQFGGIDVSHHQLPKAIRWNEIALTSKFAICRATYGTMRDRQTVEHIRRARAVGLAIGVYHFFRPSQPWKDQLAVFHSACEKADYRLGDIVPALDVEADPIPKSQPVTPAWQEGVQAMLEAFRDSFGGAIVYITQREYGHLGKPIWIGDYPLWVAYYRNSERPATPSNMPWLIWQHRVGPYDPHGPGGYFKGGSPQLDQNRLGGTLPRVGTVPTPNGDETLEVLEESPRLLALEVDWDLLRRDRDAAVHDELDQDE